MVYAVEVRAQHRRPLVVRHLEEQPLAGDAGVVDEDVEAARALDDRVDQTGRLRTVAHVGLVHEGMPAVRLDRAERVLGALVLLAVVDADGRARARQPLRDRAADAARGTRDQRNPPRQLNAHRRLRALAG